MAITIQDVEYIAKLARLEFTDAEKEKLVLHLNEILTYMTKLNKLDTTDIEPLSQVLDLRNVFREDAVRKSLPREEALKNAPDRTEEFFLVPKVIEK